MRRAGFGDRVVVALGLARDGVEMVGTLIDVAASLGRVRCAVGGGCWVNSTRSTALYLNKRREGL